MICPGFTLTHVSKSKLLLELRNLKLDFKQQCMLQCTLRK